jgi:hypothetical protein
MTIVEVVDSNGGFAELSRLLPRRSARALAWGVGLLAFWMSAVLDNLTTTIVMLSLLRKVGVGVGGVGGDGGGGGLTTTTVTPPAASRLPPAPSCPPLPAASPA